MNTPIKPENLQKIIEFEQEHAKLLIFKFLDFYSQDKEMCQNILDYYLQNNQEVLKKACNTFHPFVSHDIFLDQIIENDLDISLKYALNFFNLSNIFEKNQVLLTILKKRKMDFFEPMLQSYAQDLERKNVQIFSSGFKDKLVELLFEENKKNDKLKKLIESLTQSVDTAENDLISLQNLNVVFEKKTLNECLKSFKSNNHFIKDYKI